MLTYIQYYTITTNNNKKQMSITIEELAKRVDDIESKMANVKVSKEKKEKKEKKEGDSKPKRAPSGYNLFCKSMRDDAKEKVKDEEKLGDDDKVPATKVMQMLGKMWKELSEEEQKEWKPTVESNESE